MVEAYVAYQPPPEECIEPNMEEDFMAIIIQNGEFDQVRTIEGLNGFSNLTDELKSD